MTWVAVGGAAVTAVAGYAKSRSDKKAADKAAGQQGAMTDAESTLAMERTDFEMNREQYYKQLERRERQRGLDEFRKFNTVQEFAPGYANTNPEAIIVPELYDPIAARNANKAASAAPSGGGDSNGGLEGILRKPIDVHKKIAGSLF